MNSASTSSDAELPPLPKPRGIIEYAVKGNQVTQVCDGFGSDQMHAYAIEYARLAALGATASTAPVGLPDFSDDMLSPEQMRRNVRQRMRERCQHDYLHSSSLGGDVCSLCGQVKPPPSASGATAETAKPFGYEEFFAEAKRLGCKLPAEFCLPIPASVGGDALTVAYFRQMSSFGPWYECKATDDGAVKFTAAIAATPEAP